MKLVGISIAEFYKSGVNMLKFSFLFLMIAIISAFLGFGELIAAAWVAEVIFYISVVVFLVFLITGLAIKPPKL